MRNKAFILYFCAIVFLLPEIQGCDSKKKKQEAFDEYFDDIKIHHIQDERFAGGDGSVDNPYLIATAEQLAAIGSNPKDLLFQNFKLINDIDLDPNLPGGRVFDNAIIAPYQKDADDYVYTTFMSRFDGDGHKIKNLTIHSQKEGHLGLFGCVGPIGRIYNLGLENVSIIAKNNSHHIGVLVGDAWPQDINITINNCYATGKIFIGDDSKSIGGLVGCVADGTISNCYADIIVSTGRNGSLFGGLAGWVSGGRIINCYSAGNILCGEKSRFIGGLVGGNAGTITNCYSSNCFSIGQRTSEFCNLVGQNYGNVNTSYYLKFSDINNSEGDIGIPLTDTQMKREASFINWDFENIWMISEGSDYPKLRPGKLPAPPKPSPPDLSKCNRLEVELEFFLKRKFIVWDWNHRDSQEKRNWHIDTSEKIIVEDQKFIQALNRDLSLGIYVRTGGSIAMEPYARITCYYDDERLTSFEDYSNQIYSEEGYWFKYDKNPVTMLDLFKDE